MILYEHSRFERNVLKRSPDGKLLLFGVRDEGDRKSHLFTIPVEGGKEKELYAAQGGFETAMWSPDGKYIYFTDKKSGSRKIELKFLVFTPMESKCLLPCVNESWKSE